MKHVRRFANAAAIQTILNSRETTRLNKALNKANWNSLRNTFTGGAANIGVVNNSLDGGGAGDVRSRVLDGNSVDKSCID